MLRVADEVAAALADGRPVVALESTIIAHGLPRPDNLRVAAEIEDAVRSGGAVPATVAVLDGEVRVGLDEAALERIALEDGVEKLSLRDLGPAAASGRARRHDRRRDAPTRPPWRASAPSRPAAWAASTAAPPDHLRRVGRPDGAGGDADRRGLRRGEVDPRRRRDPRAARDALGPGGRLPHRPARRLLPQRRRPPRALARGRARRGGGHAARAAGPAPAPGPGGGQPAAPGRADGPGPPRARPDRRPRRRRRGRRHRQGGHPVRARRASTRGRPARACAPT